MRCAPSSDSGEAARQSRSTPADTARPPGEAGAARRSDCSREMGICEWPGGRRSRTGELPLVMQPYVLAFPLLERLQQRLERDALEDSPDLAVARANRVDQR